jgi:hypothetical protein
MSDTDVSIKIQQWINYLINLNKDDYDIVYSAFHIVKDMKNAK